MAVRVQASLSPWPLLLSIRKRLRLAWAVCSSSLSQIRGNQISLALFFTNGSSISPYFWRCLYILGEFLGKLNSNRASATLKGCQHTLASYSISTNIYFHPFSCFSASVGSIALLPSEPSPLPSLRLRVRETHQHQGWWHKPRGHWLPGMPALSETVILNDWGFHFIPDGQRWPLKHCCFRARLREKQNQIQNKQKYLRGYTCL